MDRSAALLLSLALAGVLVATTLTSKEQERTEANPKEDKDKVEPKKVIL